MSSIITEGGQYPDPRSLEIQTHWLKTEYPNMTMAPFVKINYDFRDIHADFDVHLDDRIEHPSRERALIFDVCGVIVHIDPEYIILFVPIPKIWKVFIPNRLLRKSPFVSAGHEVCLGQWMKVAAVQRSPPRDGLPDDEPKYSHICYDARNLRHFNAAFHLPQWEHRFVNGVFQVKMVIPLTTRGAFKKQHDEHGNIYWIADSGILQALIPCHRLAAIRDGNWRGSVLIFWVNRGRVIGDYCIHLFEREHIEEHKIDGTVLLHVSPFQYPEEFNRVQTNADFVIVNPEMAQESDHPVEKEEASVDADNNLVDDSTASYRSPSPEEIPLEFLTLANEKPWNDEDSRDTHAFEQQVANEFEFLDRNPSSPNPLIEVAREQGQPGQNAQSYRIQLSPNDSKADIDEFLQSYIDPDIQALLPDNYPRMTLCSLLFELFNPRTMDVIIAEDFERELHQIADFLNEHHSSTSNATMVAINFFQNKSITGGDDAASEVFVPYA